MEDPNKHHMVSLFAMYDSRETSDDEILDHAIFCLRRCHDAISVFTVNNRFLEAHRQFQHCEDVLRERNTERKVILALPERHPDRDVFMQLESRTFLLQRKFEARRTAPIHDAVSPLRERVGPAPSPAHGGGGVLLTKRRLHSSTRRDNHASLRHSVEDFSTWSNATMEPTVEPPRSVLPAITPVMKVDTDSTPFQPRFGAGHAEATPPLTPTPPSIVKPDWRQKSQAHVQRSLEVLQSAQATIVAMRKRREELSAKRDATINSTIVEVQQANERARTQRQLSPELHRDASEARSTMATAQTARTRPARSADRQAELDKAEHDLARRLEKSVERASKKKTHRNADQSCELALAATATAETSFAGLVLRGLSSVIRRSHEQPRPLPHLCDGEEASQKDANLASSPVRGPLLPPRGPLKLLDPTHKLFHLFEAGSCPEETADDENNNENGNNEDSLSSRVQRLGQSSTTKHLLQDSVRCRLQQRVELLAATGSLGTSPVPALKMSGEELERMFSPETAQSLKYRKTNSLFFPSLMEHEASPTIPCWPVLSKLKKVADWTALRPRELMSNLDLSVATLKLQCWWRSVSARQERNVRASHVYRYVTQHHKELDAVDKIVRLFRFAVARRCVDTIRKRIAHVNEQRIELELNRGVFLEPLGSTRRSSSQDAAVGGASHYSAEYSGRHEDDSVAHSVSRHSRQQGTAHSRRRFKSRLVMVRAETIWQSEEDQLRPYYNPFPRIHPHHEPLKNVQRRAAARAIILWIRGYIFRCLEDLQQTADRCMHHILTGQYEPQGLVDEEDEWGMPVTSGFSVDPFAGDGLLAKYSGDVMQRIELRWKGDGDQPTDFMQLKRVKLSELEVEQREKEVALENEREAELERQQRLVELELLELQNRNESASLVQRVGRGFRRRIALCRAHHSHQVDQGRMHQFGALRVEKMSLSLSGGEGVGGLSGRTRSPAYRRESPTTTVSGARVDSFIMDLIARRNPDLMPERREEVKMQRVVNAIEIQRWCRAACSVRWVHDMARTKHVTVVQRWWRCIMQIQSQSRSIEADVRVEYADEDLV